MCDIIRTEQDTDITVKIGLSALSGASWVAGHAMLGQVPPKLRSHTFFRIDATVSDFPADTQFRTLKDHPVPNLLERPTLFDPLHNRLVQIWMSDQFALDGSTLVRQ